MKVKLVALTHPKGLPEEFDPQDFIAYAARVSNPSNQLNKETSSKLIEYLIKHKHWSPLEMSNAVLEIETTRDIARQILRHRSFSFQEFSQRYSNPEEMGDMYIFREARFQDAKNRQNSIEISTEHQLSIHESWIDKQKEVLEKVDEVYKWALSNGIAKEQARVVLPEGLTKSRMYMNGTIRSWYHYTSLRMGNETQKEHRLIAKACWSEIVKNFPSIGTLLSKT